MKAIAQILAVIFMTTSAYSQTGTIKVKKKSEDKNVEIGQKLYRQHCAVCHGETDVRVVGPSLVGVMTRIPSKLWMNKWIFSSNDLIKSGDAYAKKIADFDPGSQPDFKFLSDQEINSIISYIENFVQASTK